MVDDGILDRVKVGIKNFGVVLQGLYTSSTS